MKQQVYKVGGQKTVSSLSYRFDRKDLFNIYRKNSDVKNCVNKWSDFLGAGGWAIIQEDGDVDYVLTEEVGRLLSFWRGTSRQIFRRIARDLGVDGNFYMLLTPNLNGSQVAGFEPIDPRTMSIVSDAYGNVTGYIQRVGMATKKFSPEEILHIALDSDINCEIYGISPLESLVTEALTDLKAIEQNYAFFENNSEPSSFFIPYEGLEEEEIEAAILQIRDQLQGSENSHKSVLMPSIKDIKTVRLSNRDMEFLEGRQFSSKKIHAGFGVPMFLNGYTDEVNNNNGVELRKEFYQGKILQLELLIEDIIDTMLKERLGMSNNLQFKFYPQFFDPETLEQRALEELKAGVLTLRQYKSKTGQDITPEDENNPNIDLHIIHAGAGAMALEDIGLVTIQPTNDGT